MLYTKLLKGSLRYFSSNATRYLVEPLKSRSLIRVKGAEASDFLQGLITNDMQHLSSNVKGSMYSMFLNSKGRVLYDTIVYKVADDSFYVECDLDSLKSLQKHITLFRVRRKIDIHSLENDYKLYTLFNVNNIDEKPKNNEELSVHKLLQESDNLMIFKDPRVSELGYRIISKTEITKTEHIDISNSSDNYKLLRYSLGIGEGSNDLPPGNCFPLECNCDYLHGVSFHKGCYIGQELTARTHHTGVVRKRLMSLHFENKPSVLPNEDRITSGKNNLGKLRGIEDKFGLALLRVDLALDLGEFLVGDQKAKVWKPHWWPVTLPKDKIIQKT